MANMSYCRFYNTRHDLEDCFDALYMEEPLSEEEKEECEKMVASMLGFLVENGLAEEIDGEYERWCNRIEVD